MTEQRTLSPSEDFEDAVVGDLMSPALGVFQPDMTVADTVEELRELTREAIVTYCYVTGDDGRLEGLVVMRDMLLATPDTQLDALMIRDPFAFSEGTSLEEALASCSQ